MAAYGELGGATDPLRWVRRPGDRLEFDLLQGDRRVGELSWTKPHGSLARAQTAHGSWTLKRSGFLNPVVTVRGGDREVARLTVHFHESRLDLGSGRVYALRRAGLLVPAWHVLDPGGEKLFDIEPVREGRRLEGGIVTGAADPGGEVRAVLVVLAWYFIVLAWAEDEALAASAQALSAVSG